MKLFEPGKIGSLSLKNRIVMAAMGASGLTTVDGSLTPRAIDYYVARARGGAGLITTGIIKTRGFPPASHDRFGFIKVI